jgi:hypothetical protein
MIIKKLKRILNSSEKEVETQTTILQKKAGTYKVECAIDDEVVDCAQLEAPIHECGPSHFSHGYSPYGNIPSENRYIGVPAPAVLSDDSWFGPATHKSQKQLDYMMQETEIKKQEEVRKEELRASGHTVEDENIHQKMYEIATKNWTTVGETQGGSENFHEGPGGWNSGNGMGQFLK